MTYTTGTLTGEHTNPAGDPHTGTVTAMLSVPEVRDTDGNVILRGSATATLVAGAYSLVLPASDDPNLEPQDFTYSVIVQAEGLPALIYRDVYVEAGVTVTEDTLGAPLDPAAPTYTALVNDAETAAAEAAASAAAAGVSQTAAAGSATDAAGSAATAATAASAASTAQAAAEVAQAAAEGAQGAAETAAAAAEAAVPAIPSVADRTPAVQTTGTSPFTWTCPAGWLGQLTCTGGAGVSLTINPSGGGGGSVFLGGTGSSVILTPGESVDVAWGATAPTIRTRRLLEV